MSSAPARLKRWSAAACLVMIVGTASAAPADTGSRLPDGGNTKDLTMPGNGGVAGTGLGGSTSRSGNGATSGKPDTASGAPAVPGTGTSVKGPAGGGIDGQGVSADGISAGNSKK